MSALNTLFAEIGLKPDFHTATIRNMADSGGHNPSATLLSENPGVDLKMFAGGGGGPEGGYDNSATLLRAPADPVPVLKFSGGNGTERQAGQQIPASIPPPSNTPDDEFNFIIDVLRLSADYTELDSIKMINSMAAIKAINDDDANMVYAKLIIHDDNFKEFLRKKGISVENAVALSSDNSIDSAVD